MGGANGKGKAGPRVPSARKGSGKKRKTFSEDLGLDHLKALTAQIAGEKDERHQKRLERAKQQQEQSASKLKHQDGSASRGKGVKRLDEVKARLKAKVREKAKRRKEARNQKASVSDSSMGMEGKSAAPASPVGPDISKKRKTVAFA
ncbi:hypothetical protein K437DRAFT_253559 [Tilletiaria anomala UBC 951]|uniref:Uncharacterized protein n=1 Tax=Tilletiaria anomala (strain ATCC 24038 / CBS 436.72 / UBC 951) TaxID=1037660 RepID=A0A066WGL7_TILAU|nr:uncharacterized protein K437DRAFT_253559 [Tilletiaria anomala UBC 951]KDN52926.1 hypothetical protein K437DRAFT_253559 [Tilletiaria anomala UBC 951]